MAADQAFARGETMERELTAQRVTAASVRMPVKSGRATSVSRRSGLAVLFAAASIAVALVCFSLHLNLSSTGFLQLLLVLFVAIRFGFAQASLVSVVAFFCLNFLFTDPLFTLSVADPQNWVALFTFEATALLVSGLSSKLRLQAALTEEQKARAVRLYELSRAVLLIDQRGSTSQQLARVIERALEVEAVHVWTMHESSGSQPLVPLDHAAKEAYQTYLTQRDTDDALGRCSNRVLRLGVNVTGGMTLRGWTVDPLSADAVASIAAIALERAHATHRESRAEAERDAERLRGAVLDSLAHGFKTPLTAIQTASSGLLAIDGLNGTQAELVSIIDERATMLARLTTRLLQTAALEAKEVRVRRSMCSMTELIDSFVAGQEPDLRERLDVHLPDKPRNDHFDRSLVELALQQLVDNAAKYSAIATPIALRVEYARAETLVIVENTTLGGASIRFEERGRIFERFYRGIDAVRGPSGTGLGLSIVKKIADAHGGHVWAECGDHLTRFTLAIPVYDKEQHG